jgi:hypothetical protein
MRGRFSSILVITLKERSDLRKVDAQVLHKAKDVVEIATLHALNDAADLLRCDLGCRIDVEG